MSYRVILDEECPEKATYRIAALVTDDAYKALPVSALTTLTLTLYNAADQSIINSRNAQTVLNANGGTVDALGNFVMLLGPSDNVIVDTTQTQEEHVALFEWTYNSGSGAGKREALYRVANMAKVS